MFGLSRFKKLKDVTVEFQFGAYYSINSTGGYDIIRLLHLPGDSYHYQLIATDLAKEPRMDQLKNMKLEIFHIPMDTTNLLGKKS